MTEQARKSSQEVEIDHLLAEEFACDPSFAERFLEAAGISCPGFACADVTPEPSLGGQGYGDLLVEGVADGRRVALLIEDKITAGPAVRQAARYADYAAQLMDEGWDQVWTVLAAPRGYVGERAAYDAFVDLETVADLLRSETPARQAYRRGIVQRALGKRAASGVKVADVALHAMRTEYRAFSEVWAAQTGSPLVFPTVRERYFDGESHVYDIRFGALPDHVTLRHRLWLGVREVEGQVDLIVSPAEDAERAFARDAAPVGTVTAEFSGGKGVQVSIRVPQMRQTSGFDQAIATQALEAMRALAEWYLAPRD